MALTYKIATEASEFEQIHRLNHQTFAIEIPQHLVTESGALVDRFHDENTYFICLDDDTLIGMVALRERRPFSLDAKLPNLDDYLGGAMTPCEVRLLAVRRDRRGTRVFLDLTSRMVSRLLRDGRDAIVISGTVRQELYRHIGFTPFGPKVGADEALYQPMLLDRDALRACAERYGIAPEPQSAPLLSLLPGPVPLSPAVRDALLAPVLSHRSSEFAGLIGDVRRRLCRLTTARNAAIMAGAGTFANDVVAAQLARKQGPGLILSNGEFGERLVDHARGFALHAHVHRADWGEEFDWGRVGDLLDETADIAWVWAVHCETSTGVLNDIASLKALCAERGIALCLDCISSLGVVDVDLSGVALASGVSGKGLRSVSGLAIVFADETVAPQPDVLPRSLDLGRYLAGDGVPYTHSSSLLGTLRTALGELSGRDQATTVALWQWLRDRLEALGVPIITPPRGASPAILTFALPAGRNSVDVGDRLVRCGYLLSYRSDYLVKRNWMQICLMAAYERADFEPLLQQLAALTR